MRVRRGADPDTAAWCGVPFNSLYRNYNKLMGSLDSWVFGSAADPVTPATGNLADSHRDLDTPSWLYGMHWTRRYNSLDDEPVSRTGKVSALGSGYTTPVDMQLTPLDQDTSGDPRDPYTPPTVPGSLKGLEFRDQDGRRFTFPPTTPGTNTASWVIPAELNASVSYSAPPANHEQDEEAFTLTRDTEQFTFNKFGSLLSMSNGSGQVARVCRDDAGRPVELRTGTTTGTRADDCTAASPVYKLAFHLDPLGRIDKVTRPDGAFVQYLYGGNKVRHVTYPRYGNDPSGATVINEAGTNAGAGSSGDGGPATQAQVYAPAGMAVDGDGNLLFADPATDTVRKIDTNGVITRVAGDGAECADPTASTNPCGDHGPALSAQLTNPTAVAVASDGTIYIADTGANRVRWINPVTGEIRTLVGDGTATSSGDNDVARLAKVNAPAGLAIDQVGDLYIAEATKIRKLDMWSGLVDDLSGAHIYTFAGSDTACPTSTSTCGDGDADATTAQFNHPHGITVAWSGDVYVADTGDHRVRKIGGNVTDARGPNAAYWPGGTVTTVAGTGTPSASTLNSPTAVGVDGAIDDNHVSNLYIADTGNNVIRVVPPGGTMATFAGTGSTAFDGGYHSPTSNGGSDYTNLNAPAGIAVEAGGIVHVADTNNSRIRAVVPAAGVRYYWAANRQQGFAGTEESTGTGAVPVRSMNVAYDNYGRVTTQDMASGEHTTFTYTVNTSSSSTPPNQPISEDVAVGYCSNWTGATCIGTQETTTFHYPWQGRLSKITDAHGKDVTQTVTNDRVESSTDREGNKTGRAYDTWGRITQVATPDPATGFVPPLASEAGTETCKRATDKSFPEPGSSGCTGTGKAFTLTTTTYCTTAGSSGGYDPRVATTSTAYVDGSSVRHSAVSYQYSTTGVDQSHPCGTTGSPAALPSYATQPEPVKVSVPAAELWYGDGSLKPLSYTQYSYVSGYPYLIDSVTDPDGVVTRYRWNTTTKRMLSKSVGNYFTTYGYDSLGRLAVTRTPEGEETWYTYDARGAIREVIGPIKVTDRTCQDANNNVTTSNTAIQTCTFPSTPDGIEGPTTRSTYWPDGSLKQREQRPTRSVEVAQLTPRVWTYSTDYRNSSGTCTPPQGGCEREVTETEPPHGTNPDPAHPFDPGIPGDPAHPGDPASFTKTVHTTHYNSAGQAIWVRTSDTNGVSTPVTSTTSYQTNPADPATNLGLGRVYATTTPGGTVSTNGYDGNTDATGNFSTAGNGELTSTAVGTGSAQRNLHTRAYDRRGRLVEDRGPAVTDDQGTPVASCVHYTYDGMDRVTVTAQGAAVGSTVGGGCAATSSTGLDATKTVYDDAGRATYRVTDSNANGTFADPTCPGGASGDNNDNITQTTYTAGGRAYQTLTVAADSTSFDWCTGAKRTTTNTYDLPSGYDPAKTGWLKNVGPPAGAYTAYGYDGDGRVTTTSLYNYPTTYTTTQTLYDPAGRVTAQITPSATGDGQAVAVTCYDAYGQTTYQSDPFDYDTYTPCANGTAAGTNQYRSFAYYPNGALQNAWSALRTQYSNDAGVDHSDYTKTSYVYDGRGNRTARTSYTQDKAGAAYGTVTEQWAYTADDQLASYTDPAQKTTSYAYYDTAYYTANPTPPAGAFPGRLRSVAEPTDLDGNSHPVGRVRTMTYRADGQPAQTVSTLHDYTAGTDSGTVTENFAYNATGELLRYSDDSTGTDRATTRSWDRANHVLTQSTPYLGDTTSTTLKWTYSLDGTLRETTYPDTGRFQFSHDALGRLTSTSSCLSSCTSGTPVWYPLYNASYTAWGTISAEQNIGGYASGQYRSWTYGNVGTGHNGNTQPTGYTEVLSTLSTTLSTSLYYRHDTRLDHETTGTASTYYGYDDAGQLCAQDTAAVTGCPTTGATTRWTYNTRGLRLTQTTAAGTTYYAYNANAQLCTVTAGSNTPDCGSTSGAGTTYGYDNTGRQTSATTSGSTLTATYDARGLNATNAKTGTGGYTETRKYNAKHQLVRTTGAGNSDFLWDDQQAIPQILDWKFSGTLYTRFIYGIDRISFSSGVAKYYAYDAHGSVIKTSAITAPDSYDPYGNPTFAAGTTPPALYFGYRGELTINGTVHLRARDYLSVVGGFTTRDPLPGVNGTTTVANPYHYADNDPLNLTDPSGMHPGPNTDGDYCSSALTRRDCVVEGGSSGVGGAGEAESAAGAQPAPGKGVLVACRSWADDPRINGDRSVEIGGRTRCGTPITAPPFFLPNTVDTIDVEVCLQVRGVTYGVRGPWHSIFCFRNFDVNTYDLAIDHAQVPEWVLLGSLMDEGTDLLHMRTVTTGTATVGSQSGQAVKVSHRGNYRKPTDDWDSSWNPFDGTDDGTAEPDE